MTRECIVGRNTQLTRLRGWSMSSSGRFLTVFATIIFALLSTSCVIKELKDDLDIVRDDYGYLKGQATFPDREADILIGLIRNEQAGPVISNVRTVSSGEPFYVLVSRADYILLTFSDVNGDLVY